MEYRDRRSFLQICRSSFHQPISVRLMDLVSAICRPEQLPRHDDIKFHEHLTFPPRNEEFPSIMASILRPAILRQTCFARASQRSFSTKLTSSLPAINRTRPSDFSRPNVRCAFVAEPLPGSMRVAAFHASGQKAILPALPRK